MDDISDNMDVGGGSRGAGGLAQAATPNEVDPDLRIAPPVLCVGSRSPLDEAAAAMLVQVLQQRAIAAALQPLSGTGAGRGLKVQTPEATLVCLSYFGTASKPAHVRYVLRRLKRVMPHARFVACFWMLGEERAKLEEWRISVGADFATSSIDETALLCARELSGSDEKDVLSAQPEIIPLTQSPKVLSRRPSDGLEKTLLITRTVPKSMDASER